MQSTKDDTYYLYLGETNFELVMPSREEELQKTVDKIIEQNGESELFNRAFLKPIEICLKTWQNQEDQHLRLEKRKGLPYGIKQALKADIRQNKFKLADFEALTGTEMISFKDLRQKNWDNIISVLKGSKQSRIKLAICICMYSEDKPMLRRTISGVKQNIANFVKNGIPSHEIIVCVIMDGIEVVHPSILEFVEELQKESGVYLSNDVRVTSINNFMLEENLDVDEQEIININNFIFQDDFEDRKIRQFTKRKQQYLQSKKMIKRIQQLELDKTITFESLDNFIQPFFYNVLKQRHKDSYGLQIDLNDPAIKKMIHQKYIDNISVCRPIIREALSITKRSCIEYITTRQSLALLNSFRVDVQILQNQADRNNANQEEGQGLNQDRLMTSTKMNLMFLTKYKNGGKLSSHDWFFNGICEELKPQYSVLLDVGLAPEKDSLFKMIQYMQKNEKVGGVCGYMGLKIERVQKKEEISDESLDCISSFCLKFVDIQRAQQLEYHFAHLIDKPFEASFGFIHVLPGAFSAYRMKALKPSEASDSRLLKQYFSSIKKQNVQNSLIKKTQYTPAQAIFKVILPDFIYDCCWKQEENGDERLLYNQNVYLAEDRTLCLGIYLNGFNLHYLPDAYAWVDPMKTLHGLLGQRKRWINGSFFAFSKVKKDLDQSKQGTCFLGIQILYLQLMNMLAFVAPALFLFTLHIAMFSFYVDALVPFLQNFINDTNLENNAAVFIYTVDFLYVMVFLGLIFYSMHMTNKVVKFQSFVYGAATAYGLISIIIFVILAYDIIYGLINSTSFLIDSPTLVELLTGTIQSGILLIQSLRYLIVATFALYIIPICISLIFFCRMDIMIDIFFSSLSFMFFGSTYLNILNIYALCRIDDISWGTKGLDAQGKGKETAQNWKKIKIIHVSKLVLWNGIIGFLLLGLANEYKARFYLTLSIMVLLAFTMFIKVFLAIIYIIIYKCCRRPSNLQNNPANHDFVQQTYKRVSNSLKTSIKKSIRSQVVQLIQKDEGLMQQFNKGSMGILKRLSKIQKHNKNNENKMRDLYLSRISHISNKPMKKQANKKNNNKRQILDPIDKSKLRNQIKEKNETSDGFLLTNSPEKRSVNSEDADLIPKRKKQEEQVVTVMYKQQSKIKGKKSQHKRSIL